MKLRKNMAVRIVKRQDDRPAPEKRMTEIDPQGTSLSNAKKTVMSWVKEFRNKPVVELQPEFSKLFGATNVLPGRSGDPFSLSHQLVSKKKLRK